MKQNVNPVVAAIVIALAVCVAGFALWYGNRERPRPEHVGLPPHLQQMENARAGSFKVMPQHGKPIVKPPPRTEKEKRAAEMNANYGKENSPAAAGQ